MHCCQCLDQFFCKYLLFQTPPPHSLLFSSMRGAKRWDRKCPQRLGPSSLSLMDVRCVRGGRSVSVFHVSSQHDEQGSSWRWTEPAQARLFFIPTSVLRSNALLLSQCNILVLIKANKGKHAVMGEERTVFWFPGEPDSSLFTSSHYKSCGSSSGWMAILSVSLSWLQRSSRRTALLLLTATAPNSMLQ